MFIIVKQLKSRGEQEASVQECNETSTGGSRVLIPYDEVELVDLPMTHPVLSKKRHPDFADWATINLSSFH